MGQDQIVDPKRTYVPCLEGIRGYGFLLVFCGHYLLASKLAHPDTFRFRFLTALSTLGLFAVPAFFVLSGYLIGGLLYHTRNREGFFKVFYSRRFLRVFPVYYLTLAAIAIFYAIRHIPTDIHFWMHFLYIQNLVPGHIDRVTGAASLTHFWSLAVEEQFYLVWPLIVWRFRDKSKLIGISIAMIAACCLIRLAAPLLSISVEDMSFFTPTRVDAVLLGVLLSLVTGTRLLERIRPFAKWVALGGCVLMGTLGVVEGDVWAMKTYTGKEIWITLANVTAVAIIIAVLEEGSLLNRICSWPWICKIGALSYSLYIFHFTFRSFFLNSVTDLLLPHMRQSFANLLSAALALCATFLLSLLSYRLIERPVMNLKRHVRYGAPKGIRIEPSIRVEPVLVEARASQPAGRRLRDVQAATK